jgi:hypothetical protein
VTSQPDLELVSAALGSAPQSFERVGAGGYTRSERWQVETVDGRAFVKQAEDDGSLHMLRREALVYQEVHGSFLPGYVGFADSGARAVLAVELLEDAHWPPPYPADTTPLFDALAEIAAASPPAELPPEPQLEPKWEAVASDPEPMLQLGVCSRAWLESALPTLAAAEQEAVFEGNHLSHSDVYSANVCFEEGRALLVDWGAARRGSPWIDVMQAVQSVRAEGGAVPPIEFPNEVAYAAAAAGHFAVEAPLPLPEWSPAGSTLREDMAADLGHALRWAAELLGLPLP